MKFSLGIEPRELHFFLYFFLDKDESMDPLLRREVGPYPALSRKASDDSSTSFSA